jgi:hypothetical protein
LLVSTVNPKRPTQIRKIGKKLLDRVDTLADRIMARAPEDQGYAGVPFDALRPIHQAALRRIVTLVFIEQRPPSAENLEWLDLAVEARVRLGVPLDSILNAIPTVVHELWSEGIVIADRVGAGAAVVSQMGSLLLTWVSAAAAKITSAYRRADAEAVRVEEHRRARLLQGVLLGTLGPGALVAELRTYGIVADREYIPFRARASSDAGTAALERKLLRHSETDGGVVAMIGSDACGILVRRPSPQDVEATIALGRAAPLAEIPAAFGLAGRVLDAAVALGVKGIVAFDDLRLRTAVAADPAVGEYVVARYLAPLAEFGSFAAVIENTLRKFFDTGMNMEATARAMVIHPNTLRYRLRRFEEISGANLSRTEDLFEIWWALQRRSMERGLSQ